MFRFIAVQGHDVGLLSERHAVQSTLLLILRVHVKRGDAMKRSMEPRL